jgi:hypothetical protein
MGLTIHYTLKSKLEGPKQVEQAVYKMRQLALDLPFEQVGEIVTLTGEQCNTEARREELKNGDEKDEGLFWLLIQAGQHVQCSWNKHISRTVNPTRIIGFDTWPGPGSEPANFGLCVYPAEIEWEYDPQDDQRFQTKDRSGWHRFDWRRWDRHCKRVRSFTRSPAAFSEIRNVATNLSGWYWRSFCKTQYASNAECGGIPNFLRCHISVITLLDRIAKIPGVRVRVDDEGKYGPSTYSDDWKEAYEAGRKPTYRRHKGQYNPAALAKEVGEWNTMIAGFTGALSAALADSGIKLEAAIKEFPDFEQLRFQGRNQKYLTPFLRAMKAMAGATEISAPSTASPVVS